MLLESTVIGILAGGWASSTYWPDDGLLVGIAAGLAAWFVLVVRNESKREKQRSGRKGLPGKEFYELHK